MTEIEYLERKTTLDRQMAELDAERLRDREFMDGDRVTIDIKWKSIECVICDCFIDKGNGTIQYRYHPLKKDGTPSKRTGWTFTGYKITKL